MSEQKNLSNRLSYETLRAAVPHVDHIEKFADANIAPGTRKAYESAWRQFAAWCEQHGLQSLPAAPVTVASYLCEMVERKRQAATLCRHLAAIAAAHRAAGEDYSPTQSALVRRTWRGIRRQIGTAQAAKRPLRVAELRSVIAAMPDPKTDLRAARDRALLLLGFSGALRCSELVALDVEDVGWEDGGIILTIRREKTDQESKGQVRGIPHGQNPATCPIRTLRTWLESARIESGPIFRSITRAGRLGNRLGANEVARIVKARVRAAGLDPKEYSSHSLRAGLATSAAEAGAAEWEIMSQTGHRSERMVRRYIRRGVVLRDNVVSKIGL